MARKTAKQIGALWAKKHKAVGEYFTGVLDLGGIGEVSIAIFRNDRKQRGKKHPDYRIVLSRPIGERDKIDSEVEEVEAPNGHSG